MTRGAAIGRGAHAGWWLLGGGLAYFVMGLSVPGLLGVSLSLPGGRHALLWPYPVLSAIFFIAGPALAAAAWFRLRSGTPARIVRPLSLLPLALMGLMLRRFVSQDVAANVLFLVPAGILASVAVRAVESFEGWRDDAPPRVRGTLVLAVAAALAFAAIGLYFSLAVGEHSGDEGHYMVQADSLYHDRDLDVLNNLGYPPEGPVWGALHISQFSKKGHVYSWHPFGLPVLLAPFVGLGLPGRHLLLGLLSGLALAGTWRLCRSYRARTLSSSLVLLLFALSTFWGIYSARCLPEVPAAALVIGLALAFAERHSLRWRWVLLGAACCGYLPWLHTRFIPVAAAGAGMYVLALVACRDRRGIRWLQAAVFSAVAAAFWLAWRFINLAMFEGGMAYPMEELLFSYPLGVWQTFASDRSITWVMPMFAWMLCAAVWTLVRDRDNRLSTAFALVLMLVILVTSSTTKWFTGGSCLSGRFLLAVSPLFVPCAARVFDRAGGPARWWLAFLGLVSVGQFLLMLAFLPRFGKAFADPRGGLSALVAPLEGLLDPFGAAYDEVWHPFGILLFLGTMALVSLSALRRRFGVAIVVAMIAGGAAAHHLKAQRYPPTPSPAENARRLAALGARLDAAAVQAWGNPAPIHLLEAVNWLAHYPVGSVTSADLGVVTTNGVISLPRVGVNDWEERGHRWATLAPPFRPGRGERICSLHAGVEGPARVFFAIREGSRTLLERELIPGPDGEVKLAVSLRTRNRGDIYILARLEGDGFLRMKRLAWSPISRRLVERAHIVLPRDVREITGQ